MHVVCVSGPRQSFAFCHMHFSRRTNVDHRVVCHIILHLLCSMCTLFPLHFHGFGAVHCETLATKLYLKSFGVLQLARRHVCFATFKLGVFLSMVICACHAVYLSVWQR